MKRRGPEDSSVRVPEVRSVTWGRLRVVVLWVLLMAVGWVCWAQRGGGRRRAAAVDRGGVPEWTVDPAFRSDVFTFARIRYSSTGRGGGWGGWGRDWSVDYPDADLNLSFRLEQLTSLRADPEGKVIELTDKELVNYPFIYIVEPGDLVFSDEEVTALRRHLLSGGFLMVDDFWGDREYENFYAEIKRVFPDREPQELPMEHEIFNCVFPLREKPQIPNIARGTWSQRDGVTWEYEKGPSAREVHYRGILDDKDRVMVMICHNTDLGDGWEREGENEYYFREFSEKKAYPLGINIIFYAMTH